MRGILHCGGQIHGQHHSGNHESEKSVIPVNQITPVPEGYIAYYQKKQNGRQEGGYGICGIEIHEANLSLIHIRLNPIIVNLNQ
jgi:hypothetical protein